MQTYTDAQKSVAKALIVAYGNAEQARRVLEDLWRPEGLPAPPRSTISEWRHDPRIEPDEEFLSQYQRNLKARLYGSVDTLIGPLQERLEREIDGGKSLDVLNLAKAWGITADKVGGGKYSFVYNDNRRIERDAFHTFGPTAPELVEGEFVEEE